MNIDQLRAQFPNELFAALVLAAGIIYLGVLPSQALDLMTASVTQFSNNFVGGS